MGGIDGERGCEVDLRPETVLLNHEAVTCKIATPLLVFVDLTLVVRHRICERSC